MASALFLALSSIAAFLTYHIIYRLYFHPLRTVPGPYLAKITKAWFIWQTRKGTATTFLPALHTRYGPIVRIAPDQVLCNSAEAIRAGYAAGTTFTKGDWYYVGEAPDKAARGEGHLDLLTERDIVKYRQQKRAIGPAYSIAGLEKHEGILNEFIPKYVDKLRSLKGKAVDLAEWTHIYALDALSWFTLSKSLNYTEQGHDGGNLAASDSVWGCFTVLGMFPWFVQFTHIVPIIGPLLMLPANILMGLGIPKMWPIFGFCIPTIVERIQSSESMKGAQLPGNRPGLIMNKDLRDHTKIESKEGEEKDMLATIMQLQHNKEAQFNPSWALGIAVTNFGAGHDTIMHTLSSCIYNLATHPSIITTLRKSMQEKNLSAKHATYTEIVNKVPLYHAVLKESLRIFPPLGWYVPRVVPSTGATISSTYLPPGTTLGISLWATHNNPDLFPNPDQFSPERWVQDGTEEKKREIGRMDAYWMGFGGQSRSCPGQYLGRFFVIKVLARLVEEFDFEVDGRPEFVGWFAPMMKGVGVRFVERGI